MHRINTTTSGADKPAYCSTKIPAVAYERYQCLLRFFLRAVDNTPHEDDDDDGFIQSPRSSTFSTPDLLYSTYSVPPLSYFRLASSCLGIICSSCSFVSLSECATAMYRPIPSHPVESRLIPSKRFALLSVETNICSSNERFVRCRCLLWPTSSARRSRRT